MLLLFLAELALLEEAFLNQTCTVHADHRYRPTIQTHSVKVRPFPGKCLEALVAPTPIRQLKLVLTNLRDYRHVGRQKFTTRNRFRIGIALVFDPSLNSVVWQSLLLYLLITGSSSTIDRLTALR